MAERTDTERLAKLADIMWWSAADHGLPARWVIEFADATGHSDKVTGSVDWDADLLRKAIDAMMDAEPTKEAS